METMYRFVKSVYGDVLQVRHFEYEEPEYIAVVDGVHIVGCVEKPKQLKEVWVDCSEDELNMLSLKLLNHKFL